RHLVIAVEVVLVGPVAELDAFQKLVGDVGITGSIQQGWEPIEAGDDAVLHRAGLDVSGPTDDGGHAEAAFKGSALGALERGHTAIGPGEHFGAVVGGEDNDGVIGFADIHKVFENLADAVVHLRHAGLFQAVVGRGIHLRLVLGRDVGEDVHARGVVPDEEGLAILLGLVHGAHGVADEHFVKGLHVVLGRAALLPVLPSRHVGEGRQRAVIFYL